jgi:hypothetical protein
MKTSRSLAAGIVLCLLSAGQLAAQLSAVGTRDLEFGTVIPGVVSTVAPTDPVKSGLFDITAPLGTRLRLDFILPANLIGPAGAPMTLNFANGDAILLETGPGSAPNNQNPKSMKPYTMKYGNRLLIYLGGNVAPTGNQSTGAYSATVVLTVTVL